jgi:hypothetical protein
MLSVQLHFSSLGIPTPPKKKPKKEEEEEEEGEKKSEYFYFCFMRARRSATEVSFSIFASLLPKV